MTVTMVSHGSIAKIVLSGKLDYSTQEEFRSATEQALSNRQVSEIQVDFAAVDFLDSSVIRAMLILQKEADGNGKQLVLSNCNPGLREVFEIGGFDRMFTFR
jgi:anti-anti-sigma factor